MLTVSPIAVYSVPAIVPTSTSPVLIPTRIWMSVDASLRSSTKRASVCCIRSPARTARSASSS
jgi:hypothetical protein